MHLGVGVLGFTLTSRTKARSPEQNPAQTNAFTPTTNPAGVTQVIDEHLN